MVAPESGMSSLKDNKQPIKRCPIWVQDYLKPAIGLVLGAVGNKLKDGGGVVAGVVLLAVREEDARDELPVHDLVLLLTVHLVVRRFLTDSYNEANHVKLLYLAPVDDCVVLQPLEVHPWLAELHFQVVRPVVASM